MLYCPSNAYKKVNNTFGKLYLTRAPVIGIIGTSKQQGKFTIQLQLRKKFQKMGYAVGQLGTEPTAPLFGMDEVYPIGYNGLNQSDLISLLEESNYLIHSIDVKKPDIIIAGSQSGFIPKGYYNSGQIPLSQLAFMLGVNPDAVILCMNVDDSPEYVSRAIYGVESLCNCKVIGIAVYPLTYANGWGIIRSKKSKTTDEHVQKTIDYLERTYHIPVVVTGEKSNEDKLIQSCLHYFSGGFNEQI